MTLIEVLVSLLIFSLGFLGLIGMQARALQVSTDAQDRSRAALLANEIVSQMWIQRTTALPAASISAWQARVTAVTGLPNAVGSVGTDAAGIATVTLTWHPPSSTTSAPDSKYITQVVLP